MIPVLYSQDERDYGHNGIGVLSDVMYYTVTEEANGEFELYLEYPVNGRLFQELQYQRLIKAKPNDLDGDHVFRIYEIVKDLESHMVYIYATSKTNDLGTNLVKTLDINNKTAQEALNLLKTSLVETTEFNFVSDITTRSSTYWEFRNPLSCIVGEDNSLVKYWGGEVKRTNDTVYLYSRRGRDNVTVLREGKNVKGLEFTVSTKGLVTKIVPYFIRYDEDTGEEIVTIGNTVSSPLVNNYPIVNIIPVDYTLWDELETAADLNAAASGYFTYQNPGVDKPKVSLDIDIMQLSESSQYKQYSNLESLIVFDSVTVYLPKFDVNVEVKVNKTVYNGLLERADTINCGDPISSLFDDVRRDYTELIGGTESKLLNIVQKAGEGSASIFRGPDEPVRGMKPGDLWYKPIGGSDKEMYQWTGAYWELILSTKDINTNKELVDDAMAMAEQAQQAAEQAYSDSVAEAERLVEAQTVAFDAEMNIRKDEIADAKAAADSALAEIDQAIQDAGFTSLSQSLVDIKAIAEAAETDAEQALLDLKSKATTAALNAYSAATDAELALKASKEALEDGLALKVATNTYNAKVAEMNSLITAAQTKADTAAEDLLKKADTAVVNAELAKKLATSTYNTKMTALDTAISGHNTRIKATEDGLVLTATKVEVDDIRTRMSEAETEISQNSDAIALKASQLSLDATNGKLATAEASLVVQATQIASKVSQTDFNALNGRVGTAESSITQQATQIASKVSQTDFNALNGRVGTAESSISQQAGEIALRVTTATYNAGIGSKENTITKSNTAPSHLNGRLWLDTSVTPNVMKRSTGSAWVKVTPTTAGEVGAYSASAGSTLAGRVSTAETSITANTTAINLRATKTDLDAAKGRLTTAEGTIAVQAGQIALKANQTTVDSLTGRIGTAETSISANTTAINLRATKTDVNALAGRMTTAEGTITAQAGQIALKANTTTVSALTGRMSAAEASLVVQSGKIDLAATKTELTTAIDGIEVGGRNLIQSSNLSGDGTTRELTLSSWATTLLSNAEVKNMFKGQTQYTFSYDAELTERTSAPTLHSRQVGFLLHSPSGAPRVSFYAKDLINKGDTYRYEGTFICPEITDHVLLYYTNRYTTNGVAPIGTDTVRFTNLKLEKGNKATDWTPAPEDVDAAISTVQSNLTVEAGKIASKVSQTDFNALNGRVGTAETTITQQAGQIALKASQTSVNTLTGRVGTAETNITANTTAINLRATKTSVDTLTGRVTTAEGSITTQAGQIALRATTATVNALTGRVSTAESTISANTTAINLRATKTEAQDYATLATKDSGRWTRGYRVNTATPMDLLEADGTLLSDEYSYMVSGVITVTGSVTGAVVLFVTNRTGTTGSGWTMHVLSEKGRGSNHIEFFIASNGRPSVRLYGHSSFYVVNVTHTKTYGSIDVNKLLDDSIATVQSNLTVEAGKITSLTTRVGTAESNITSVTQTVSGINTTISTLRTDVNGKATIVSLNAVKSTADGNKTTISNHAGRLTTVETTVSGLQTTVSNKADKSQITQLTTSISTKVESATYNSKMTQLDTAINLRVVQGDVTAAILADKKIKDTRANNQLPSWYYTNYPSQRAEEFKTRTAIGVPGAATYVKLVTDVPWSSTSGGVVVQTSYSSDGIYNRSGNTAGTAWGAWVKQTDSANVLAQVNLSTEGVLIQGKRIQLDGDVTMTAAYVTKLNTQTLSAITANITSIRSQVLVTDSVTSTHIKAENALIDTIFGTTALITRLTSKTAFINNIKAINISADKITTGTLNATNVNIINLNVSKLVGDTANFVKSAWNGLNSSLSIDSAGLKSYTSNLEIRLTAGYTRYYISNVEVGYMAPLVSTSDTTIKALGIVAPSGGQIVLGRQVTNGIYESLSINGDNGYIAVKRPLDFSLSGVDLGRIYGNDNGLIISSSGAEIQFFQGGTSLMYGVAGGLRMYRQINMNQNSIDNVTSLVANDVATPTVRKVATLATDNLLKFTRAGVTYSEMLAGGFRMHIQINMNTNNLAGVGTLTYASDARYKSNITTREVSDLDIIRNIRYVDYTFNRDGSRQRGLIAQELVNADSKLVTTSENGYLSYDSQQYTHAIGHGLQELDGNVRDLRDGVLRTNKDFLDKIEELENKIQQLEEKLA